MSDDVFAPPYVFRHADVCRVDDIDGGELVMYLEPREEGGSFVMRASSRGPYRCWIETERLLPVIVYSQADIDALEREAPRA